MNSEIIIKVIDALVGSVEPYGSSHIDEERIENLRVLLEVMDEYIAKIDKVVKYRNRPEYSMREMGEVAYDWFIDLKGYLDEFMEEYGEKENEQETQTKSFGNKEPINVLDEQSDPTGWVRNNFGEC